MAARAGRDTGGSRARPPAVARVLERVVATARAEEMFEPRELVLVACSGGPDSLCLLHALVRLRRLLRIRVAAFHFDHRLRPGSERDAAYVERQAERLGVPVFVRRADDRPAAGQSVEAWARLARYSALTSAANDAGAGRAALGHTLDDQAETVLLGLIRGGGLDALAGMAPVGTIPPLRLPAVRPLLGTTRAETVAFCRSLRLRPRDDPMNRDPRFLRSRLRHEILPLLEKRLDRGVRATLSRAADHVRGDASYLDGVASEAARGIATIDEDGVRLSAAALVELPEPIGARVVRQALRLGAAMGGEWEPEAGAAHIRAVLGLAGARPGRRVDLPGALLAERTKEYVSISRASPRPEGPAPRASSTRSRPTRT